MKTKFIVTVFSVLFLIAGIFLWGQIQATGQRGVKTLNSKEKEAVNVILKDKQNYCVGNYSIELPVDMMLDKDTKPVVRVDDTTLVGERMYYPSFHQRIQLREAELKKTKPIDPADGQYLKSSYPLENGVIFERMESIGVPDSERVLEAHFYKDGVAFTLESKARNETAKRYENEIQQYPELAGNNVPQKIKQLNDLIPSIFGRTAGESYQKSTLCFFDGSVTSTNIETSKLVIAYTLQFKNFPELFITLIYDNDMKNEGSLVHFKSYDETQVQKRGGKILNKGDVELNSIHAEQWLSKDILHNGNPFYEFYLVINGEVASKEKPKLTIIMSYENKNITPYVINDSQMLVIWNKIIHTIQIH